MYLFKVAGSMIFGTILWTSDYLAGVLFFFFFLVFCPFRAAPAAYGDSHAKGPIGAVAAGLRQSHSNTRSELRLRPTPQLTATPHP